MKRTLQNHILDTFSPIGKPYQKEFLVRNIYGSSRLGATKEAVNMQNPSLLPSYGVLGNRNYELSDHRGNVQTVINDIKYPIESNGSITSYEVGISSISDYSPFGVELDGRTIENNFYYPNSSVDTLFVSDTLFVINNDFENPTITTNGVSTFIDGWKDFSQSTISIENTGGNNQLKVVSNNGTHGIHQTFAIENGETYTFEVDLTKVSVPSGVVNVVIYQGPSPGVPYSVHVLSSNGTNTFSYTANSSDIYVQIRQSGTYLLDNIRLYREYEDTVIVGGYAASGGYRYSFQNQEKHDEIRGKGKYINYKYRGYDPRVGRLDWMMDPLADSYPWNSPYAFSENRVIDAVELEGLEKKSVHRRKNPKTGGNFSGTTWLGNSLGIAAKGKYTRNIVWRGSNNRTMESRGKEPTPPVCELTTYVDVIRRITIDSYTRRVKDSGPLEVRERTYGGENSVTINFDFLSIPDFLQITDIETGEVFHNKEVEGRFTFKTLPGQKVKVRVEANTAFEMKATEDVEIKKVIEVIREVKGNFKKPISRSITETTPEPNEPTGRRKESVEPCECSQSDDTE